MDKHIRPSEELPHAGRQNLHRGKLPAVSSTCATLDVLLQEDDMWWTKQASKMQITQPI